MQERPHITIHPHGTRQTDQGKVHYLALTTPEAFTAAQDLLVATENFIQRRGLFTSHKARWDKMIAAYKIFLAKVVVDDGINLQFFLMALSTNLPPSDKVRSNAIAYLSEVSEALPNWQEVYAYLDWFIWEQDY